MYLVYVHITNAITRYCECFYNCFDERLKKMPKRRFRHYQQNKCAINRFFYKMIQLSCNGTFKIILEVLISKKRLYLLRQLMLLAKLCD
jgi:hypothetical protein